MNDEIQIPGAEDILRQALQDYAVVTLDTNGRIVQWSGGAERIFGWRESEVVGRPFNLLFTPEDEAADRPAEELKRAIRGEASPDERWHMGKDGRRIFVAGIVRALRSEGGEITGFSKVAREITAQKLQELQREAALQRERAGRLEAEKRWKYMEEIFENLPALVALVRLPEETYVFANRGLRELAGSRELVGRNIRETHPGVDDEFFHLLENVAAGGAQYAVTETLVKMQHGGGLQERYFDFLCEPMGSGTGDYEAVLIFGADVTDRVRARRELQAERDRLKIEIEQRRRTEALAEDRAATVEEQAALLDLAQDGIIAVRADGSIQFWNSGAERMYGWSKQEAIGKNIHDLLRTEFLEPLDEILRTILAEAEWEGELKHVCRGGKQIVVSSRWVLRKRGGEPAGWLEIVRDITERKQMEAQLRQADKLESLGVLAGGIAHDFNNLLTGILGNTSLAMDRVEAGSPIHNLLSNALVAGEHAATLTKQILAYAGKGNVFVEPVNISGVVRNTMKLIGGSIPGNVRVELALEEGLPPVPADETQLEQVAINLILNAAEAIGDRGGNILVRTAVQEVDSTAAVQPYDIGRVTPGRYVVLEVEDNGAGIEGSIKPNIFDPFFTTKFTGRGLGLAALSGIVRALQGAVLVESAPGHGTVFRVLLPAGAAAAKPDMQRTTEQYPILVVDDEVTVRQVAGAMLQSRGYEVILADDGQEALDIFRRLNGRISVVLLDMTMPGTSGAEVFRRLKTIRSDIPVILSSGYTEQEAVQRFGGLGVAGFLQKPYTPQQLIETIARVLK